MAANGEDHFYYDLYRRLSDELNLIPAVSGQLPEGVTASCRAKADGSLEVAFVQNYNPYAVVVKLDKPVKDYENGTVHQEELALAPYEVRIVQKA